MVETWQFSDRLRSEYAAGLLDAAERGERAKRLHSALHAAGLWPVRARILDVGCGAGLLLAALGSDARLRVGCDLRRALYLQARQKAADVVFAQCDGRSLPFRPGSFDLVICLAVIEEFSDWRNALEEMTECVAPGGLLYITVTNGPSLLRVYRLAQLLGRPVPNSYWEYARASLRMPELQAASGFGLPVLAGWRHVPVTPHLARSAYPWLRGAPLGLLNLVLRHVAPSFGYAWQRPQTQDENKETS